MTHNSQGPDYGTNYGLELGIPGTNSAGVTGPGSADLERYSGMPVIQTGLQQLGNDARVDAGLAEGNQLYGVCQPDQSAGRHEVRGGFDFVRLTLDHWQPEVGNPRGTITSAGGLTGTTGYSTLIWNNYASFLLGLMSSYGKSVQFEEMTGRENQCGLYLADRWQVNEKLTVNLGLRYELPAHVAC